MPTFDTRLCQFVRKLFSLDEKKILNIHTQFEYITCFDNMTHTGNSGI